MSSQTNTIPNFIKCRNQSIIFDTELILCAEALGIPITRTIDLKVILSDIENHLINKFDLLKIDDFISIKLIRQAIFLRDMTDHGLLYPKEDPTCFVDIKSILWSIQDGFRSSNYDSLKENARAHFGKSQTNVTPTEPFKQWALSQNIEWGHAVEFMLLATQEVTKINTINSIIIHIT